MNDADDEIEPITIPNEELLALVAEMLGPVVGLLLGAPDEMGTFPWSAVKRGTYERVSGTFVLNLAPTDDEIDVRVTATVDGPS